MAKRWRVLHRRKQRRDRYQTEAAYLAAWEPCGWEWYDYDDEKYRDEYYDDAPNFYDYYDDDDEYYEDEEEPETWDY